MRWLCGALALVGGVKEAYQGDVHSRPEVISHTGTETRQTYGRRQWESSAMGESLTNAPRE